MEALHVGRGVTRGGMTVFPVFGGRAAARGYITRLNNSSIAEAAAGPDVATLVVDNPEAKPLLLLAGQILEGGWQNRMLAASVLVAGGTQTPVGVVCVESGRWSGSRGHTLSGRRGSSRVRAALVGEDDVQGLVWERVSEFDGRLGANPTNSYTAHADRADDDVAQLSVGLRPIPGQVGLIVGLAGQPVIAEIMDSHITLAEQFDSIIHACALDALWLPTIATPARRARRFLGRAERVQVSAVEPAGIGVVQSGRSDHVEVSSLQWRSRSVHTVVTNLRHELVAA